MTEEIFENKKFSNSHHINYFASRELFNSGRRDHARMYAQKHLDKQQENHQTNNWSFYFQDSLIQARENLLKLKSEDDLTLKDLSLLGVIEVRLGNRESAFKYLRYIESETNTEFGRIPYYSAPIHLHLGQKEIALELLKQSIEDGAKFYHSNVFENDPTLQPLKNDPDFKKVIFPYN